MLNMVVERIYRTGPGYEETGRGAETKVAREISKGFVDERLPPAICMIWDDAQFISVIVTLPHPAALAVDVSMAIPVAAPIIARVNLRIV